MNRSEATPAPAEGSAATFYDRFASIYNLMFRVNGYGRAVERCLREHPLPLAAGARVLDAGCGTGLLTLALLRVLERPARITALDLSNRSLVVARRNVSEERRRAAARHRVHFVQANVLALPFPDGSFDCLVTSGVLEYVPIGDGMRELARVLVPGGYLFHLPVRPSAFSRLLEIVYRFKTHPPDDVARSTRQHFRVLQECHFPPTQPIGWSKFAVLAQKT